MAKSKGKRKVANWSAQDHQAARDHKAAKKAAKAAKKALASGASPQPYVHKREALKRDTAARVSEAKDVLSLQRLKRQYDSLREQALKFDRVEYEEARERKRLKAEDDARHKAKSQKERRALAKKLDPSQWSLKGGARPASSVCTSDVRYVDPHAAALSRADASRLREVDLLAEGEGDTDLERDYAEAAAAYAGGLLRAGKVDKAKKALEGAKGDLSDLLIRIGVEEGSLESVRPLLRGGSETQAWTEALVEFVSLSLGEEGSGLKLLEDTVERAVEGGYEEAGWRLAWPERFASSSSSHYDGYAETEQLGAWQGTEGAVEFLRGWLVEWVGRTGGGEGEESWRAVVGEILEEIEGAEEEEGEGEEEEEEEEDHPNEEDK